MKNKIVIVILMLVCFFLGFMTGHIFNKRETTNVPAPIETEAPIETDAVKETEEIQKEETKKEEPSFVKEISAEFENLGGKVQWAYKVFGKDSEGVFGEGAVPSASVIKVFIMEYIYTLADENGDTLSTGTENLVKKMIIYSDNDATNTLIDKYGMDKINDFIKKEGYTDTILQRKMLDEEARRNGRDNFTSASDVLKFLDKLYNSRTSLRYSKMLEIMKEQTRRNKIPARLPSDVVIANKTGENTDVENDVGIIFSEAGDVALVFLCTGVSDRDYAQSLISDASLKIYNEIN